MTSIRSAVSNSELLTGAEQVSRALGEAFDVWSRQRDGEAVPVWSVHLLAEYPAPLLPWAVVAVYEEEAGDFRVRYWGSERASLFKRDSTNKLLSASMPAVLAEKARGECLEVRRRRQPLVFHSSIETVAGTYTYCKIRLPLRPAGSDIADVVLSVDDPDLITAQIFKAWDASPPLRARRDE